ncbi:MAG TPA: hypothetical protein VF174_10160 [Micromonosporaceae bacterium]
MTMASTCSATLFWAFEGLCEGTGRGDLEGVGVGPAVADPLGPGAGVAGFAPAVGLGGPIVWT